jgi:hypothetical protein
MNFAIHVDCKECDERLDLVTCPPGHEKHLHFRCRCMPLNGVLCVSMKVTRVRAEDPS